ncbi:unnamed protein product [Closterium sp. NIES-53]
MDADVNAADIACYHRKVKAAIRKTLVESPDDQLPAWSEQYQGWVFGPTETVVISGSGFPDLVPGGADPDAAEKKAVALLFEYAQVEPEKGKKKTGSNNSDATMERDLLDDVGEWEDAGDRILSSLSLSPLSPTPLFPPPVNSKYDFTALSDATLLLPSDTEAQALAKKVPSNNANIPKIYNIIRKKYTVPALTALKKLQPLGTQLKQAMYKVSVQNGNTVSFAKNPNAPPAAWTTIKLVRLYAGPYFIAHDVDKVLIPT